MVCSGRERACQTPAPELEKDFSGFVRHSDGHEDVLYDKLVNHVDPMETAVSTELDKYAGLVAGEGAKLAKPFSKAHEAL